MFAAVVEFVGQQKITPDMALPVPFPIATQGVIEPFRPERVIVGDQQQHCFLEPIHVIAASPRQPLPVLQEGLRVVRCAR
ncbi:hypothetical protein ADT31_00340 (plasmid) [Xylella fastidiosa]|nr:hypothetical protein ADT31_00340 [Xylella fastidiosa]